MGLTGQQRVMGTLTGKPVDGPPWMELYVHPKVISLILGEPVDQRFGTGGFGFLDPDGGTKAYEKEIEKVAVFADRVHLDAIGCKYWTPVLVATGGHSWSGGGLTTIEAVKEAIRTRVPDISKDGYYACGEIMLDTAHRHGQAGFFTAHLVLERLVGDLGFEQFCYALYDDRDLVRYLCEFYTEFAINNIRNMMKLKPDFIWIGDDIAYGQGPVVSPAIWEELFMPYYREICREITCPWVFHSDGNPTLLLDSLLTLGMQAIHPLEPYSMDIRGVSRQMKDKVVLVGNVDMNLIQNAPPQEMEQIVTELYRDLAAGKKWILSSSNSIDAACKPENVRMMGETLSKLRLA